MVEGFYTQVTTTGCLYCMGIQSQNINDYKDSYLLMAIGAGLIIAGVLLAVRLYLQERKLNTLVADADLNRQIKDTTRNARGANENYFRDQFQPQYAATVDMDTAVTNYRPSDNETATMNRNLDETYALNNPSLPGRRPQNADQDETVYMVDDKKDNSMNRC